MKHKRLYLLCTVILIVLLLAGVYYYWNLIWMTVEILWDTTVTDFTH